MRLLYCDETNLVPKDGDFFVYGGLSIPCETAFELSEKMHEIREESKIPNDFNLKFNPGPAGMSHQDFIEIKQKVISAAVDAGCELYVSVILHNIASDVNTARRNEINRVVYHFNCSLNQDNEVGLVLLDRFNDSKIDLHVREKISVGLTDMPYSTSMRLSRILGIHYSAIGQACFPSVIDIIIGSLRFCINEHTHNKENPKESTNIILQSLSPLFPRDHNSSVPERNLFFSPKVIKVSKYKDMYLSLNSFFASSGINPAQEISDIRTY